MIHGAACREFQAKCKEFLSKFFSEGGEIAKLVNFVNNNSDSTHFFDYLVERLLRKAFDSGRDQDIETVIGLLAVLVNDYIDMRHMERGFEKFFHIIDDMALDVPSVYTTMVNATRCAIESGVIPLDFDSRIPPSVLMRFQEAGFHEYDTIIDAVVQFKKDCRNMLESSKQDVELDFWTVSIDDAVMLMKQFVEEKRPAGDKSYMHELLRLMMYASMSRLNREREIVSKIMVVGVDSKWFSRSDIMIGFMRLYLMLPDAKLDVPNMQLYMAKFMSRAIVDEILEPAFLEHAYCLNLGGEDGMFVTKKVQKWIDPYKKRNLGSKLENIWDGADPTTDRARNCRKKTRDTIYHLFHDSTMQESIDALVSENLAPDLASICVRVIIEAILEKNMETLALQLAKDLLKALIRENEIDAENIQNAFDHLRNKDRMAELVKDVGAIAVGDLEKLYIDFQEDGLLNEDTSNDL